MVPLQPLPPGLEESSGAAFSAVNPEVIWTHNDSGWESVVFAVDLRGRLRREVEVQGAPNVDWEDLELAPCGEETCLYVADTGDNREVRDSVFVYRFPEPALEEAEAEAEAFPLRFPDGPRDVEAFFVLPDETLHFVTKGWSHPVTVYRYPPPLRPDRTVTVERIQTLTRTPPSLPRLVTGAGASADGRTVAVRTYETLSFYRMEEGRLEPLDGFEVNLRSLGEPQGEAVALGPGGRVALTTEAGPWGRRGGFALLECPFLEER